MTSAVVTLCFLGVLATPFPTQAQLRTETLSMPAPMRGPSGEIGMWIPQWLQRRHLEDDARLKGCIVELSVADDQIEAQRIENEHLRAAFQTHEDALEKLAQVRVIETEERGRLDEKLRRRTAALWVSVAGAFVGASLAVFAFAH